MTFRARILKRHPATLVLASFLLLIATGTILLMLPPSTKTGGIPLVDAMFTATSAACVTGLVVVDTGEYFTVFGQCVILALIQIGGLGVMTISVALFRWIGKGVSFRQRMIMQDLFAHTPREDIPTETVNRSISLVLVSTGIIGFVLFLILLGDCASGHQVVGLQRSFLPYFFETVSAFGTAGLSMGVTSELDMWGKSLIVSMMIVGRVGVLAFAYIIVGNGATNGVEYSEENMMVG